MRESLFGQYRSKYFRCSPAFSNGLEEFRGHIQLPVNKKTARQHHADKGGSVFRIYPRRLYSIIVSHNTAILRNFNTPFHP